MMTHSRGVDKKLCALAEQCGGVIKKRDGELWLEPKSIQLTYQWYRVNGIEEPGTPSRRLEIAKKLLADIIEQRSKPTSAQERYDALLNRIEADHVHYRPMHFQHLRQENLDEAVLFRRWHATIWIEMDGHERREVQGTSFAECLDKLRAMNPPEPIRHE